MCGGDAAAVVVDDASVTHVAGAVEAAVSSFGRLDALVNYAGVRQPHVSFDELTVDVWDSMFAVHARGAFLCLKHGSRAIAASGGGSVVLVSSMGGVEGYGSDAAVGYCAAKAAIVGFSRALALELAPKGVAVSVVALGYFPYGLIQGVPEGQQEQLKSWIPFSRFGGAPELGGLVVYLFSDAGAYTGGQIDHLNGGLYSG